MRHGLSIKQLLASIFIGSGIGLGLFAAFVYFRAPLSFTSLLSSIKQGHFQAYVVTSGSMEPSLKVGSVIFTQKKETYKVGDIITFKPENSKSTVSHRVIGKTGIGESVFITKGDANEEEDPTPVTSSQVVGETFIKLPYIGYIVNFAKTPRGFVALVIIPASIIIYEELKVLGMEIKKVTRKALGLFKRSAHTKQNLNSKKVTHISPLALGLLIVSGALALATGFFAATLALETDTETSHGILGVSTNYSSSPEPSPSPTTSPTNLVINEFMPNPVDDTEWVELYNPTDNEISLTGWALDEGDQGPKPLDTLVSIPSHGFVVYQHTNSSWLDNGGETLTLLLLNPASQEIDSHTYTISSAGVSIGRQTDASPDWISCQTVSKGSSNNSLCI